MAKYLAVPLKRTWEVDLVKPLRTFISNTFGSANQDEYLKALVEFNKLRFNMMSKSVDKHESALEVLYRYYDQLVAIGDKFPIEENQIRVSFKWQDAFDKESFFSGRRTLSIASARYEQACMLFNIAALQSQIAEVQNADSDEGLKTAAKYFQSASGIYAHLKSVVLSHVQNDPTPDMTPDTLGALSALMLAQAQDCFCRKAMNDKMKPLIIAKLCHQGHELYAEALKLLQLSSIRDLWPKEWIGVVAGKQAGYHALMEYYQSHVEKAAKEFGAEIARLQHAKDLMAAAENRSSGMFMFSDKQAVIIRGLQEANKDNEFIYHAKIPDLSTLTPVGKAVVAKVTPLSTPFSQDNKDLFDKVVPLAVHQALTGFENRKADVVNREIGRLREATQLLNSVLASLNLPAAIEDLSGATVPQSVMDKGKKLKEEGGIACIEKFMVDLPELLTRNREILTESTRMLDEEQASDIQLREQFRERWTRTQSEKLTAPIRQEAEKYNMIIDNAIKADSVVRERYGKSKPYIDLLSKPDGEIANALPSGSPVAALQGSPVVGELRQHMEQVETIKAERDVIEKEIKDAKCDMSSKFMMALAQDGAINEADLSQSAIDTTYATLRGQVSESIQRQENLLSNIQRANDQFVQAKSQTGSGSQREQMLKELATAYDSFSELKSNLTEGTKFYNELTVLLVKFQSKVTDLCFARKTEKEDLMKDLQNSIANQRPGPPPPQPTYQQPTAQAPPPGQPPAGSATAYSGYNPGPYPTPYQPSSAPYPTYGAATPYPVAPPGGYAPMPMPMGYNPYASYGYPPQQPQGGYPGQYPGYGYPNNPPQQWR